MRMNFVQDATAKIEGLLDVNRDFCRKQIGQKLPQMPPPNCAVLPLNHLRLRRFSIVIIQSDAASDSRDGLPRADPLPLYVVRSVDCVLDPDNAGEDRPIQRVRPDRLRIDLEPPLP